MLRQRRQQQQLLSPWLWRKIITKSVPTSSSWVGEEQAVGQVASDLGKKASVRGYWVKGTGGQKRSSKDSAQESIL